MQGVEETVQPLPGAQARAGLAGVAGPPQRGSSPPTPHPRTCCSLFPGNSFQRPQWGSLLNLTSLIPGLSISPQKGLRTDSEVHNPTDRHAPRRYLHCPPT